MSYVVIYLDIQGYLWEKDYEIEIEIENYNKTD